jgi:hypothetical protein
MMAFTHFKENLIDYLGAYIEQAGAGKKRQTFGEASDDSGEAAGLSVESATELRTIIATSLTIAPSDNGAVIAIDMDQVRNLGADLATVNPGMSFLVSFENVQITVADTNSSYVLTTSNEVPTRVITTYDAYFKQEQAKPDGLKSLNELIANMGQWLVNTCSAADKQAECFDQLMNTCARDVAHVEGCVAKVQKFRAGRDAHHSGNDIAAGWHSADGYIQGELQKASDGVSDFFGWMFGQPQP